METVAGFIFLGSKITADGDCSHEIKRHLFLGRKVMTNLDSILKNRDITLPTKVHLQGYGFSSGHVWMWELDYKESWAPKNWCFWTVVLEKTSILKEISPGCSLEGLMLKLKLQSFDHLIRRTDSLQETLMLGKIAGGRRRGWQRMRWLDGIRTQWMWVWVSSGIWWWTGMPGALQSIGSQSQTTLSDWTELNWFHL